MDFCNIFSENHAQTDKYNFFACHGIDEVCEQKNKWNEICSGPVAIDSDLQLYLAYCANSSIFN